ncbi:carbohydrate ABC transporter permease [Bauldia litoralis]|uniref:carbohydrate ABC transporter permease n=1 Tax=Bauldia litoralis TaxID=665467 RepID=UPI003265DE8F
MSYAALAFFVLFPIVWILMMSFKDFGDIIAYPPRFLFTPTLANFEEILLGSAAEQAAGETPEFLHNLLNSIIISGGAVIVSALIGVPAAFALARGVLRGSVHIRFTFLSFRFAPELAIILPLFVIYKQVGLYDSYVGMILVNQLITLPLVILITTGFFREIPIEIEEAAVLDGAGIWMTLTKVLVPIVMPGIASAMIIAFIFSWNNLVFGLVLAGGETRPVTVGILQAMTFDQIKWGLMAAAAMVAAVPGMIAAVWFQKQIIRGLTLGAVK